MKIIYHCYGGSHSSVIAAALHLKLIEKHRFPTAEEIMAIPYYDKTDDSDFGSIRFMGIDESGNEVYVLGRKGMSEKYNNLLNDIAAILGEKENLLTAECLNRVNISMKLGGFLSRRAGFIFPGRAVVLKGTQAAFMALVNLVESVRLKTLNKVE